MTTVGGSGDLAEILACPSCKRGLGAIEGSLLCPHCHTQYARAERGQPDLRLKEPLHTSLAVSYDPALTVIPEDVWTLPPSVAARLPEARRYAAGRPQPDIVAWLLSTVRSESVVLDLGARANRDRELIAGLGGRYIGVEIADGDAMVLGDAHAIPLTSGSVDIVLSMSVFEHLKNPFLAASEIMRVLKPGGRLIGIVGFLEAVHGLPHGSFFHHSYLGVYSLLVSSGFRVEYLQPGWPAIHSMSRAMLPGVPKRAAKAIVWPLKKLQDLLYVLYGYRSGDVARSIANKKRNLAAAIHFAAVRPSRATP
ncbi:MAG: methyltransferase domain-containing protein [Gemmatimonadaceae bacterium]